jgi:hypothetical protein
MAGGDATRAIPDFDRTIQLKPDLSQAYTHRGNAHLRQAGAGKCLPTSARVERLPNKLFRAFWCFFACSGADLTNLVTRRIVFRVRCLCQSATPF